jgi:hypothetical protein
VSPELRRIVAVVAHLRATSHLAKTVHALGTGESFSITLSRHGFVDDQSGVEADLHEGFSVEGQEITLTPRDNVLFDGVVGTTRFWGRAGGGSSVTLYLGDAYFQYAMA